MNGLHLFWEFWMILSQNNLWRKIFFLSYPRHCNRRLIVDIIYNFQIWNKKEHNIIRNRVISSFMGPMSIETPYICAMWNVNSLGRGLDSGHRVHFRRRLSLPNNYPYLSLFLSFSLSLSLSLYIYIYERIITLVKSLFNISLHSFPS